MAADKYGVKNMCSGRGDEAVISIVMNKTLISFTSVVGLLVITVGAFTISMSARSANIGPVGPVGCKCHLGCFL